LLIIAKEKLLALLKAKDAFYGIYLSLSSIIGLFRSRLIYGSISPKLLGSFVASKKLIYRFDLKKQLKGIISLVMFIWSG